MREMPPDVRTYVFPSLLSIEYKMAIIKVYLLNFHHIISGIHLLLKNVSSDSPTYYEIDRWRKPKDMWSAVKPDYLIKKASSKYCFQISADPQDVIERWQSYWMRTQGRTGLTDRNCAVAAQWFLSQFAGIPKPNLSNVSLNHFCMGIFWPSFIPCPVTLPGRVMSNAKFYVEKQKHFKNKRQSNTLGLYFAIAVTALFVFSSLVGLIMASAFLTGGLAAIGMTESLFATAAGSYLFFKTYNQLSAQKRLYTNKSNMPNYRYNDFIIKALPSHNDKKANSKDVKYNFDRY